MYTIGNRRIFTSLRRYLRLSLLPFALYSLQVFVDNPESIVNLTIVNLEAFVIVA